MQFDSFDKVVGYFKCVTRKPFEYKGKIYESKPLIISPYIFKNVHCILGCGACCFRFGLDYLPREKSPDNVQSRIIEFNGKFFSLKTDRQIDHDDHFCRHLQRDDIGKCGIHGYQPFSCDFELIKFISYKDQSLVTHKVYGRGWSYTRFDGEKGALCETSNYDAQFLNDTIRKFKRLKQWAEYFDLDHCVDDIIKHLEQGPTAKSLTINTNKSSYLKGLWSR